MDDYLQLTVLSTAGEAETAFKGRLTAFWSHLLRTRPDDYEQVYAEATAFDRLDGVLGRRYMVGADSAHAVAAELTAAGLAHAPLDPDDLYSKYEAAPPDWFWIEH